jgi:hypothetical protein
MPLDVIKQPDSVSYSQEPILLSLKASNVFTDAVEGRVMKISITFDGGIVAGKKIIFTINGEKITFTAVDNYVQTDMADTFPAQGALSFSAWYPSFASAVASNYFYSHRLAPPSVDFGNQKLTFTTLLPTTDFVLSTDIANATYNLEQTGIVPYLPIYEIIVQLESNTEGVNDSHIVAELAVVPETSGDFKAEFYLEKFLQQELTIEPPTITTIHEDKKRFKRFFILYTEKYGEPAQERLINVLNEVKYVVKGGFDWVFKQQVMPNIADYLGSFLTSQPSEKRIGKKQPEYLYFFNNTATQTVNLYVKVQWIGGSFTTHTLDTIELTPKSMTVLPVSWQHLNIVHPNFPEKEPLWYEVSLAIFSIFGFNGHFTNVQKYIVADQCDARFLIFQNKRGGMDTIRILDNKAQHIISSKKETLLRIWHRDSFAQSVTFNRKTYNIFKVQTGPIDRLAAVWLQDLFASDYVWEIDTITGIYIPVIINTDNLTIIDGKEDLFDIQFEFQYAIEK